jgi:flagella basal body P-ring formation protein FlgA
VKIRSSFIAVVLAAVLPLKASEARDFMDETVVDRARHALEAVLRERHAEIERFDLVLIEPDVARWQHRDATTVEIVVPDGASLGKRACVLVRHRRPDGIVQESAIWWSIRAFRPVAVSRRVIRVHEAVNQSDVVIQSRDVAGVPEVIGDIREIGPDRRARRFIPAGTALQQLDLDYVPEVSREQQVRVKVGAGQVLLETVGVAAQEGRTGEVILVTNPASRMRYPARVTGIGEVSVGGGPR